MTLDLFEWKPSTSNNHIDNKSLEELCSKWFNNYATDTIVFSTIAPFSSHRPSHFLGLFFFKYDIIIFFSMDTGSYLRYGN